MDRNRMVNISVDAEVPIGELIEAIDDTSDVLDLLMEQDRNAVESWIEDNCGSLSDHLERANDYEVEECVDAMLSDSDNFPIIVKAMKEKWNAKEICTLFGLVLKAGFE